MVYKDGFVCTVSGMTETSYGVQLQMIINY